MALSIASVGTLGSAGAAGGSASGTSYTCGVPSGVSSGALVIVAVSCYNSPTVSTVTVTGFTLGATSPSIRTAFGENFQQQWFYKYAGGADSGTYTVNKANTDASTAMAFLVSGWSGSGNPFVDSPILQEITDDNSAGTLASWTPGGANSMLVAFAGGYGSTPSGWTSNGTGTRSGADNDPYEIASLVQTTATATGSVTFNSFMLSVATIRQSGGGTNYTASPADAEGLTDSASAVQGLSRAPADPEGITDSATTVQGISRTPADPEGMTDAASATQGNVRSADDALGITDAATAAIGYGRSADDPEGLTDSAAVTQGLARTANDPEGMTDGVLAMLSATRGTDDPEALSDSVTVVISAARSTDDALGMTDSVTWSLFSGYDVHPADAESLSDAVITAMAAGRAPADPEALSDAVVTSVGATRGNNDGMPMADEATFTMDAARAANDAMGMTDHVTAVITHGGEPAVSVWDGTSETPGTMSWWDGTTELAVEITIQP